MLSISVPRVLYLLNLSTAWLIALSSLGSSIINVLLLLVAVVFTGIHLDVRQARCLPKPKQLHPREGKPSKEKQTDHPCNLLVLTDN